MKKIIPFKKDIIFKTNISEITSISLEHNLKSSTDSVNGDLIVSGEYKINQTSTSVEPFNYQLPFSIDFSEEYNLSKASIEIDDFYYEVVNDDVLVVNIDVLIDNIEPIIIPRKEEVKKMDINILYEEEKKEENRCIEQETIPSIGSIFDMLDDSKETYSTYSIYIVREGDTLENILTKYNTTKENLDEYNDLSDMKINSKIIIPMLNESD